MSHNHNTENTPHGAALPAGMVLGHYRIISTLGQGGFGITYMAENVLSGERVVIKENLPTHCAYRNSANLNVEPTGSPESHQSFAKTLYRFLEEARMLSRLHHPNIVRVLEAFEVFGTAYYVMPWIGGQDLHRVAPHPREVNEPWLLPILRSLLNALAYLHGKNLLHRDIKPGNILMREDNSPVLIDFGTAKELDTEHSATKVGTPGYTPVEQLTSRGILGPWTDFYALGATCYYLITGDRMPDSLDRLHEEDPYRPLSTRAELKGRFSQDFLTGIDKALQISTKQRWQNALDWLIELGKLPAFVPTAAPATARTHTSEQVSPTPVPHVTPSEAPAEATPPAAPAVPITPAKVAIVDVHTPPSVPDTPTPRPAPRGLTPPPVPGKITPPAVVPPRVVLPPEKAASPESGAPTVMLSNRETAANAERKDARTVYMPLRKSSTQPTPLPECSALQADTPPPSSRAMEPRTSVSTPPPGETEIIAPEEAPSAEIEPIFDKREAANTAQRAPEPPNEVIYHPLPEPAADAPPVRKPEKQPIWRRKLFYIITASAAVLLTGATVSYFLIASNKKKAPLQLNILDVNAEAERLLDGNGKTETDTRTETTETADLKPFITELTLLHGMLVAAQPEVAPAAAAYISGKSTEELPELRKHMYDIGGQCVVVKTQSDKLSTEQIHKACDALPAEPAAYRTAIRDFCLDRELVPQAVLDTHVLKLLDWDTALNTARTDAQKQQELQKTAERARMLPKLLTQAAKAGNAAELDKLLKEGADVNAVPEGESHTALYLAVTNAHTECVRLLLAAPGINPNSGANIPADAAEYEKYRECVKLLLAAPGFDANKTDGTQPALWLAARAGNEPYVRDLLAVPGINVNIKDDTAGTTPCIEAAARGNKQILELLVNAADVDVNAADESGTTALHTAAANGQTECMRVLLAAKGIHANAQNKAGDTPLDVAATYSNKKKRAQMQKMLKAAGGKPGKALAGSQDVAAPESLTGAKLEFTHEDTTHTVSFENADVCYYAGSEERSSYTYKARGKEADLFFYYIEILGAGQRIYEYSLTSSSYSADDESADDPENHPAKLVFTKKQGKVLHGYIVGKLVCTNRGHDYAKLNRVPFTLTLP